ncbi:hypothetical protein EJB05_11078, partial [Eragrostis curvula]
MLTSINVAAELEKLYPDFGGDPKFFRRVLVIEGLGAGFTGEHLTLRFAEYGRVKGAHIIFDRIGGRAGLVVFHSAVSCSAAAEAEPAPPLFTRVVQTLELNRRNRLRGFNHLKDLIGVLSDVHPAAIDDPRFLERTLLIEGVAAITSPTDLVQAFNCNGQAAALICDVEFGDRVGVVVLRTVEEDGYDAIAAAAALTAAALKGLFCSWTPARCAGLTRLDILDALDHRARLQPSELLQSLIPLEYIRADSEMDLHFRCVNLGGPGILDAGGAYGLYRAATEELLYDVRRPARAIVLRRPDNVGVVVSDVALATEGDSTRASRLPVQRLGLYDSSHFRLSLRAVSTGETTPQERRLLPPFMTALDYTGRVVVLRGLDTEPRVDAVDVARFLEEDRKLNVVAVVVHDSMKIVLVAVETPEDAQLLVQLPADTWVGAFAQAVHCSIWPVPPDPQAPPGIGPSVPGVIGPPVPAVIDPPVPALASVSDIFTSILDDCGAFDLRGLVKGLCGLAAIACSDALRPDFFSDRAVLLTGTSRRNTSESVLRFLLSQYGSLDVLVVYGKREAALAIFTSWTAAGRLYRDWKRVELLRIECRPAPDAGFADYVKLREEIDEMLLHTA